MFGVWTDIPQSGANALAAGLVLSAQEGSERAGAELLLLSQVLTARQDYPALHAAYTSMREFAAVDDAEWTTIARRVTLMSRHRAIEAVRVLVPDQRASRM